MHFHQLSKDWGANVNGDFSGDVHFEYSPDWDVSPVEFRIPFAVLEELVGRKYNADLTNKLEDLSGVETLRWRMHG